MGLVDAYGIDFSFLGVDRFSQGVVGGTGG